MLPKRNTVPHDFVPPETVREVRDPCIALLMLREIRNLAVRLRKHSRSYDLLVGIALVPRAPEQRLDIRLAPDVTPRAFIADAQQLRCRTRRRWPP